MKLPIDMYTAILGGEVNVPTLEKPVSLNIPRALIRQGLPLEKPGYAQLERPKQRGNLYVTVEVHIPGISPRQKINYAK